MRYVALFLGGIAAAEARANPIRKVVTLMQEMQAEIEKEVEKEKDQFEKFQCYCKHNDGALAQKVQEGQALLEQTRAEVESGQAQKKQLTEEITKHKKDRADAEKNLTTETKKREEEAAKYAEESAEQRKTLAAINKAVVALEKGMGKAFLQTGVASKLESILSSNTMIMQSVDVADQEALQSFLQTKTGNSGEIVGILKMMSKNFEDAIAATNASEDEAKKSFKELENTLENLIKASGAGVEKKMELKGEVAIKVVEGKNTVTNTEKQIAEDAEASAELSKACKDQTASFESRQKDAAGEIEAIGQAIGVLNSDDALALFNKTDTRDPEAAGASFLETDSKLNDPRVVALNELSQKFSSPALALLASVAKSSLKSKKVNFSNVIKMIDDMAVLLKQEQKSDRKSFDDCQKNLAANEAKQKELEHKLTGLNTQVEEMNESIKAQAAIIEKQTNSINEAELAVAQATQQRKVDNAEFVEVVGLNNQAVGLIEKAKNKLNKFYNPDLHVPEVVEEPEAELVQTKAGQAPEMASGPRKGKGQAGNKVQALMDTIITDLNSDTQTLEFNEKTAQADYERLSSDLTKQVAESRKSITDAQSTKAGAEEKLGVATDDLALSTEEKNETLMTNRDLHSSCDFILEAFEERKDARTNEIEGLTKAKAVLSGAKFD